MSGTKTWSDKTIEELRSLWSQGRYAAAINDERVGHFTRRISAGPIGDCWPWSGKRDRETQNKLPYGRYTLGEKCTTAHRVSFLIFKGDIADGLLIRHRCDVPYCVNPNHLETGTPKENNMDTVMRGRWRPHSLRGEDHGASKLTERDVIGIRELLKARKSRNSIAITLGVCPSTIRDIDLGVTWRHVA